MTVYIPGAVSTNSLQNIELRLISELIAQDQGKQSQDSLALRRNDIAQSLGYQTPVPGDT